MGIPNPDDLKEYAETKAPAEVEQTVIAAAAVESSATVAEVVPTDKQEEVPAQVEPEAPATTA